jgi:tRNA A37 threonylcarbamoyladenosine synthetase subunit TsaC/SUA5/YrdC
MMETFQRSHVRGHASAIAQVATHYVSHPADVQQAARALVSGAVVAYGFANFYAIASRPDRPTVRAVNVWKGRPAEQVSSVTTTAALAPQLFDWSRLPIKLSVRTTGALMDALFDLGPFGFRGPAAAHLPEHLTSIEGGVRTTQLIAPGPRCPSNAFVAEAIAGLEEEYLAITSANRSRHLTGAEEEPAHYLADGIAAELGAAGDLFLLRHRDEAAARRRYPRHAPTSTTVLSFHRLAADPSGDGGGRPALVVERHGSLPVEEVRKVVERFGLGLVLGPRAQRRLPQRRYRASASPRGRCL